MSQSVNRRKTHKRQQTSNRFACLRHARRSAGIIITLHRLHHSLYISLHKSIKPLHAASASLFVRHCRTKGDDWLSLHKVLFSSDEKSGIFSLLFSRVKNAFERFSFKTLNWIPQLWIDLLIGEEEIHILRRIFN